MLRLLFKTFVVFWPFFKSVVLNDRTVTEVLRDNRQFTILFGLLLIVTLTLLLTVSVLSSTNRHLVIARERIADLESSLEEHQLLIKDHPCMDLDVLCPENTYDKRNIIDLLEN